LTEKSKKRSNFEEALTFRSTASGREREERERGVILKPFRRRPGECSDSVTILNANYAPPPRKPSEKSNSKLLDTANKLLVASIHAFNFNRHATVRHKETFNYTDKWFRLLSGLINDMKKFNFGQRQ
jgi:hypothetical protein